MSDGAYAGLRRAARASSADPDTTENQPENEEEEEASAGEDRKDDEMTDKTTSASDDAIAAARAEGKAEGEKSGFAKANERMKAVQASEHYEGRERLAASLLGHASLSADDIIASLEAADAAPAPEASDGDDAKARAEMRDNLAKEQPASTASEGEGETKAEDTSLVDNMKDRFQAAK